MKHFAFILVCTIISCSNDDSAPSLSPSNNQLVSTIQGISGNTLTIEYNQNNTVKSIHVNEESFVDFTYQDGKISTVEINFEGADSYTFTHDNQGYVNSFSRNGIVSQVNYDIDANVYRYVNEDDNEKTITLTESGDIAHLSFLGNGSLTFQYDEQKNGSMANSNNIHLYMGLIFDSNFTIFMQMSKKPIVEVSGYFSTVFQNTFDDQDFIIEQQFIGEMDEVIALAYSYF